MNCLLIDQGNTRTRFGWYASGRLRVLGVDEALPMAAARADAVWLASVAGAAPRQALEARLRAHGLSWRAVRVQDHPERLPSRYDPARLGVDRWLALLACRARGLYPAVIVDAGTATTFDALDATGTHLGGYILPGVSAMMEALERTTALSLEHARPPEGDWPTRTDAAILGGVLEAQAALVERLRDRLPDGALVIVDGGQAEALGRHLHGKWQRMEHMVLHGLAELAESDACAG